MDFLTSPKPVFTRATFKNPAPPFCFLPSAFILQAFLFFGLSCILVPFGALWYRRMPAGTIPKPERGYSRNSQFY